MLNMGQRACTSLLSAQIQISCFTSEPFKGRLMISSPSLILSERNSPYLETGGVSLNKKQQALLSEPRDTSVP